MIKVLAEVIETLATTAEFEIDPADFEKTVGKPFEEATTDERADYMHEHGIGNHVRDIESEVLGCQLEAIEDWYWA